jgi:hypothetical protein
MVSRWRTLNALSSGSGKSAVSSTPPPARLRYLIDHHYSPSLAVALRAIGVRAVSVGEEFGTTANERVEDERIIPHCGDRGLIWVTNDKSARRDHRALLLEHLPTVLWFRRPERRTTIREELAALANALGEVERLVASDEGSALHLRAYISELQPLRVTVQARYRRSPT